jgi:hypothetical protein
MLSVVPKATSVLVAETSAEVCHEVIESFIHQPLAELADVQMSDEDTTDSVLQ